MLVVKPAAGLGRRFLPLTRAIPKEMLPLGGLPLIHHAMAEAAAAGFDRAVIVLSPGKEAIRRYFEPDRAVQALLEGRGHRAELDRLRAVETLAASLRLSFLVQPSPLGLGDAVLRCRAQAGSEAPAVLLPDDVVRGPGPWPVLIALHAETGAAVVSLRRMEPAGASRFGVAECRPEGDHLRVRRLVEKPAPGEVDSDFRVFGRYVVTEAVFDALERLAAGPSGEIQLTDAFAAAAGAPPGVVAAEFAGELFDSGTPEEYRKSAARYPGSPPD